MEFPKLHLIGLIVYVTGLSLGLVGYHNTSLNLPKEHILRFFNESNIKHHGAVLEASQEAAMYGSLGGAGVAAALPATLIAPWFMNRYGRKFVLCFFHGGMNILACLVILLSKYFVSYELLLVGRIFVGLAVGFGFPPVAVYATECAPTKFRGLIGSVPILMLCCGAMIGTIVNAPFALGTESGWVFGQALPPLAISVLLISTYRCLPRSPKYSVQIGDNDAAKRMIIKYHGEEEVEESLSEIKRELATTTTSRGCLEAIRNRATRTAMILGFITNTTVGTSGLVALQAFSGTALRAAGIHGQMLIGTVIGLQFVVLFGTAAGTLLIHRFRRRVAFLASCFLCGVLLAGMSAVGFVQKRGTTTTPRAPSLSIVHVVLTAVHFLVSPAGPGCVPIFLPSELSATADRSLVSSVALTGQFLGGMLTVMLYPMLSETIGPGYTYVCLFVAPLTAAGLFLYFKLPETKGRHIDEIVEELGGGKTDEARVRLKLEAEVEEQTASSTESSSSPSTNQETAAEKNVKIQLARPETYRDDSDHETAE